LQDLSGDYCVDKAAGLSSGAGSEADQCSETIMNAGTCSSQCNTAFLGITSGLGCCLGFVSDLLNSSNTALTSDQISMFNQAVAYVDQQPQISSARFNGLVVDTPMEESPSASASASSQVEAPQSAPNSMSAPGSGSHGGCSRGGGFDFSMLSVCAGESNIVANIHNAALRCTQTLSSKKVHFKLFLHLDCHQVHGHNGFLAKLEAAFQEDFAAACGVAPTNIFNVLLTCVDPNPVFAGQRMKLLEEDPASVEFDLQTSSDAGTTTAASQFQQLQSTGTLTFPATAAIVTSDCPTCASSTDLGTIGLTPAPSPSSASTTLFMTIAVVLALLLTL